MLIDELKKVASSQNWQLSWSSNWEQCIEIALEIAQSLPNSFCRQLAFAYVEEYLPIFRQQHPEAEWVWEYLAIIHSHFQGMREENIGEFILPESESEFTTPGSNGFVKVLEELWELAEMKQPSETPKKAIDIIAGIIMCKLDERWGSENPAKWESWFRAARHGNMEEVDTSQRTMFVKSSSVNGIAAMEWISLANRLDMRIELTSKYGQHTSE